jgi:hypothetical protein
MSGYIFWLDLSFYNTSFFTNDLYPSFSFVLHIYMISLIFRRFTFGIGMLLACRGGKKNLAAYGRKAVFYRDDKDMSETQLESI